VLSEHEPRAEKSLGEQREDEEGMEKQEKRRMKQVEHGACG